MSLASFALALFWPWWFHILSSSSNWKTRTRCTWCLWLSIEWNILTNSCLLSCISSSLCSPPGKKQKYLSQLKALFNLIIKISVRNNALTKDFVIQSLLLCYRNNFHTDFHVNNMKYENYTVVLFLYFLFHQLVHFVTKKNKNLHFVQTHDIQLVAVKSKQSLFCPPEIYTGFSISLEEPTAFTSEVKTSKVLIQHSRWSQQPLK